MADSDTSLLAGTIRYLQPSRPKTMTLASALPHMIPTRLRLLRQRLLAMRDWKTRQFAAPSPGQVKERVLLRNGIPNTVWVETGTYLGDTTDLFSRHARQVYSIEPAPALYERASQRFREAPNVKILRGTSEEVFPQLLPTLSGDINFWLDGHYSAGMTYKGAVDTPITLELACIEANLARFCKVVVLVDDVRCFDPSIEEFAQYPGLDFLVDWARRNRLKWHIEHDIFVARTSLSR